MLEFALKGAGYRVTACINGAEALEAARAEPPDIVVSDILMPTMDGFTLCREWRADPDLGGIPFMFYTATYTDPEDEKLGLELGADRYVLKPQDPDALVKVIEGLLAAKVDGQRPVRRPMVDDATALREYSEALVRKLDKKVADLEAASRKLEQENAELRRWHKAVLAREGRVQELKQEVNRLLAEADQPPRYPSVE